MNRLNGHNASQKREETPEAAARLGMIVRGSLSDGLVMRLDPTVSVEAVRVGKFVVVDGEVNQYFAMIGDVLLETSHTGILDHPPKGRLATEVLSGTATFGAVKIKPMLMVPKDASDDPDNLLPVKTIPAHFRGVSDATRDDVARVFGDERRSDAYFHIGEPLDMDTPVCLNLDRWVERSNAIFGKSGTGKTFLTRLALCGAIKADKAVHLIFDMHNEYGEQGTTERQGQRSVRGLRNLFRSRIKIFSLDRTSSSRRGVRPDAEIRIPFSELSVEDILLLQRELNLPPTAVETSYLLERKLGASSWLTTFLAWEPSDIREFVEEHNVHGGALSALQRRLQSLVHQCRDFLAPTVAEADDAVRQILLNLQSGENVVIEFGQHNRPVQYMLVANILTRRLHERYVKMKEQALGSTTAEPRPLVIVIEEAHKFLSPQLAEQTIFGTIARELRKYNVTLLIVDQRPSGIDTEVLSQVGTKICCLLDDERDIDAALTGVNGASALRGVLASLDTRQQALLFGHAVPMPVVVKTRTYDETFYRAMLPDDGANETSDESRAERVRRNMAVDFP